MASYDRYTPCPPRFVKQHTWRRASNASSIQTNVLQQLSAVISLQESRLLTLMQSLDINIERCENIDRVCENYRLGDKIPYGRLRPTFYSDLRAGGRNNTRDTIPQPFPVPPRPGRLSPTVLHTVLSPNLSFFSEASSRADTSYDSELYRWLGVQVSSTSEPLIPENSLKILSDDIFVNPDASILSSGSAYSQPSPLSSPRSQFIFPLSPPPTVRQATRESLCGDDAEDETVYTPSPDELVQSSTLAFGDSLKEQIGEYTIDPHGFTAPLIFRNISLRHYIPSATVLRHFLRVIDELRSRYTPKDYKTDVTRCVNNHGTEAGHSPLSGTYNLVPSIHLSSRAPQIVDAATEKIEYPASISLDKSTRELYTEMAGILFQQVTQHDLQARSLRDLAGRLDILARQKRETALTIGMRGREQTIDALKLGQVASV